MDTKPTVRIVAYISKEDKEKLEELAWKNRQSCSELIRQVLKDFIRGRRKRLTKHP